LKGHSNEHMKAMGNHFGELKDKFSEMEEVKKTKRPREPLAKLHDEIDQVKAQIAERLDHLNIGLDAVDLAEELGTKSKAEALMRKVAEGQSSLTKVGRTVNPICCFMFSAFLLGGPLANWINGHLERKQPGLKNKGIKQVIFPESQRVLKSPLAHAEAPEARHIYQGNSISCPQVADGRPMY
jgi:hypothetical protein